MINGENKTFPAQISEKNLAALAVFFLAAISVFFFFPTVFKGLYPYQRDITYIFQPQQAFVNQIIQGGGMPLWNPCSYMGMPLAANWQSAVFSALAMPFYFWGSVAGMRIFYPAVMFLGGLFAFCFLRYKNFSAAASLAGAIIWMLGGYFTTKLEFFSYAATLSFTFAPLILSAYPAIAGISLALAFMCGYPVFFLVALLYAVFVIIEKNGEPSFSFTVKNLAVSFLVFFALAAPQILLTSELAFNSNLVRTGGYSGEVMLANSVGIKDVFNFLRPCIPSGNLPHWLKNFYLGFAGVMLLIAGLCAEIFKKKSGKYHSGRAFFPTEKIGYFWVLIFIAGLALSSAHLYRYVSSVIIPLRFIRYPAGMMFLSAVGGCVLCAHGLEEFFRRSRPAGTILLLALLTELFILGYGLRRQSGYVPPDYFYQKPPAAELLQQKEYDIYGSPPKTRFAIAPKTLRLSVLKGRDYPDGWLTARFLLKGFTHLPYRLMNVYGFGEPLVPSYGESSADEVYRLRSPDEAAEKFAAALGAGYLLSAERFETAKKYDLILSPEGGGRCYLYRIKGGASVFSLSDGVKNLFISPVFWSEDRVVLELPRLPDANRSYFFEARGGWVYPSWRFYIDGTRIARDLLSFPQEEHEEGGGALIKIPFTYVKNGTKTLPSRITLIYTPFIFTLGVVMVLCCVIFLFYKFGYLLLEFSKTD